MTHNTIYYDRENVDLIEIKSVLEELMKINPNIKGILIARYDGMPLVSTILNRSEEAVLSAILATISMLHNRIMQHLPLNEFKYSMSRFANGGILLTSLTSEYLALIFFSEKAKLGILLRDIENLRSKLINILQR